MSLGRFGKRRVFSLRLCNHAMEIERKDAETQIFWKIVHFRKSIDRMNRMNRIRKWKRKN